ncbi:dihydropteroate synthase [Paraoerskovia sediminicola]|uniref:Dihydropteroate synthase n=1 Tax=Paraoerskovia sediminicola TaxID=1138587 RepID=A0ABN6X7Z8_9CELL|nr:dihydropteroate synthase [Paraoerskovia sediminicola]BDZ40933.1 dihydropteroate synthase [Paraoerskovia sediminicola]
MTGQNDAHDGAPADGPTSTASVPPASAPLVLRGRDLGPGPVVMAIVNRTDDSFYAGARTLDDRAAMAAVERADLHGATIVDVGGVRAGVGPEVSATEEVRRVVPIVRRIRAEHPDLLVSVDTWRAEVADAAADAGADLINDTWAGHDPRLVEVAGRHGIGVVCSHTGGARPRTDPVRVEYRAPETGDPPADPRDGVVLDAVAHLTAAARRAVACGVPARSVLVDPTHDFGKNTWHSLHLLRRTGALAGLGYPLLMALSRKDFIGESLDLPADERLEGTLAATAVAAWLGARVFRAHDVAQTVRVLEMVAVLRGDLPPARAVRGLW